MSTLPIQPGYNFVGPVVDNGCAVLFDWLASPPETLTFETYELRGTVKSRRFAESNLPSQAEYGLPRYMAFVARSIHCFYGTMDDRDRDRFREKYRIQYFIGEKIFYDAPLFAIPEEGILLPFWSEAPSEKPWRIGDFSAIPRYMPGGIQFGVRLIGEPVFIHGPFRFLPVISGLMERPVQ